MQKKKKKRKEKERKKRRRNRDRPLVTKGPYSVFIGTHFFFQFEDNEKWIKGKQTLQKNGNVSFYSEQ